MSVQAVESYLADGFNKVEGWISEHILRILGHLGEEMNSGGVVGGACEIGVYKGRFLIGLTYAVDSRPSLAIDLFDAQEFNIDGSGREADLLQQFRDNAKRYSSVPIGEIATDSLTLADVDASNIVEKYGKFQFVSIDGGHEPEHVISDYYFSEKILHPGGAIIIDDFFNSAWPGVMEGVSVLFLMSRPKFVPFAIGHNKLILVSKSYHSKYLAAMKTRLRQFFPNNAFWEKALFGHEVIAIL
jgi:hypothetical protein